MLSIPNTPESYLVRSIPNSLFLLNDVECIIESMTQTSGLCRAHSSSFTVRPRVEQGTSWASDTDGKGHCRGRSGSTDFVPGTVGTERRFSTFMLVPERSQTMLGKGQVRYFVLG